VRTGYEGKALPVPRLKQLHARMCDELGWAVRHWTGIGRALDDMGVPSERFGPDRVTYYEVVRIEVPAENVVALEVARRA
jgi:hypothetical protein